MQISWRTSTRSVWVLPIFNISLIGRVDARRRAPSERALTALSTQRANTAANAKNFSMSKNTASHKVKKVREKIWKTSPEI